MSRELHQSEVRRGAENLCAQAVARARRIDEYRTAAETAEASHNHCLGRLAALRDAPDVAPWRPPLWLLFSLRGVAVGAAAGGAYSLGIGAPSELTVGLLVGGIGALVVDVVLTVVSR